ncbi:MAG: ATP-binding protein [Blautia sp.]|nr:ATP-binding protein [Blautia sp.]
MPCSVKAEYREQVIPEYQGNPLIEALPEIWPTDQVIGMLSDKAAYNSGERKLDMQYRLHCIHRLFRYFQPLEQHIDIEQRVSRSIRQGYLGRNPLMPEYARGMAEGFAVMKDKGSYRMAQGMRTAASGFTIIGVSGVGKSTAVERILSLYPQRVIHARYKDVPLALTQLVWLKLDCPHDGSLKQLCYQFFYALDVAAGTDYFQQYTKGRYSLDMLLIIMTQLVRQFQIGILVIDEIQHLSEAKGGGSDKMLNFFVTLVNTIGIPVVMIGTMKAMSILQGEFRQARRGSGQGDLLWDRMGNDVAWNVFVKSMWRYQWTGKNVAYTDGLANALYDESQGIIDIAVKLYAIVQIDAITNGMEQFSATDIHRAAEKKLGLVKPMLDALRSGDRKKILQYDDIAPVSIEDYLSAYKAVKAEVQEKTAEQKLTVLEQTAIKLMEVEVDPAAARRLAGKALASHKNPVSVGEAFKEAYRLYIAEDTAVPAGEAAGDLRNNDGYGGFMQGGAVDGMEW